MKFIAILILLAILQVQNSISAKSPQFSFECILGCTGACFSTGFQCFKKCFNECKNGRLSDETNFLPKFDEIRNYQKKENQKGDICKLPHTIDGPICKAAINRWSFDSR